MAAIATGHNDENRLHLLRHAVYRAASVRAMERPLLDNGVPLMRMAATALAHVTANLLDDEGVALEDARVTLLAGAGDNGGDGLYAAAALAENGASVTAVAVGRTVHDDAFAAFVRSGGKVLILDPSSEIPGCSAGFSAGEAGERLRAAVELAQHSHVIIDAMTGIGLTGVLHGIAGTMAASLGVDGTVPDRTALPDGDTAGEFPLVVAVDTPSGVGVDDGSITGPYIPADVTVTFGALKPCAMLPPASYACGKVTLVDFGFDLDGHEPLAEAVSGDNASEVIRLPRLADTKYSRGVTGLITGSVRYPGAAVLSSRAAAATNVGMIRYMGPERTRSMVLSAVPEAVIGKGRVQSWVVGSGVPDGVTDEDDADVQRQTIAKLLSHYAVDAHAEDPDLAFEMPPIVVDAGALDLLPDEVPPQVVITPHAGELAALLTERGEDVDAHDVQLEPLRWAVRAHELTGATVLLKGAVSIVVGDEESHAQDTPVQPLEGQDAARMKTAGSLDGDEANDIDFEDSRADGETRPVTRILVAGRAPAWLGTAGAGDVLAGMTGALLAQQDEDASIVETVADAAYLHGYAASVASQSDQRGFNPPTVYGSSDRRPVGSLGHPIVASDVVLAIPDAFRQLLS
ncbi:bifunctional ADP-dependent NAD(P)H-hydrate dehydratase/NAD(P)H-hydrate epimerase [Bifidobacterium simiiventris]|uniref:bifunctional ADP-dependent NAD(P)H-hydrate dehydratase/NAD(P)H-hydrate epimerase n=1 Tax=Bifidobacterium simiiventris TaxID=2834434 RepID=UPI001C58C723|nr:bifunctional ADP-dependent NAD(P)H-hydrate dehydratase/NAD(P)H-hydrate epimerase [Bifidobacterium simiiventris]MBW3079318.1 bifunctional ADP-dependent NAD(P)H-hydrate dehydratase/NAD(P)H-hydrate epimerase [Bifidobacterium simiiventris]